MHNYRVGDGGTATQCAALADFLPTHPEIAKIVSRIPVLFYDPQQLDADGNVVQHFCLGICPPFGVRMLQAFPDMPHLDATGGLNILGFSQLTMLVQDEFGNGVPVAFCIAGSETADVIKKFVSAVTKVSRVLPTTLYLALFSLA